MTDNTDHSVPGVNRGYTLDELYVVLANTTNPVTKWVYRTIIESRLERLADAESPPNRQ